MSVRQRWLRAGKPYRLGPPNLDSRAFRAFWLESSERLLPEAAPPANHAALIKRCQENRGSAGEIDRVVFAGTGGTMPTGILSTSGVQSAVGGVQANYDDFITAVTQLRLANAEPDTGAYGAAAGGCSGPLENGHPR